MSFFTRQRWILLLAALFAIAAPWVSYAQVGVLGEKAKAKAVETLTNGVLKELEKKFADIVAKEALPAAVKANIVKNLSEMSRPAVKKFIDGAASGKLPNQAELVNSVFKDIIPRAQELVAAALTGGDGATALPAGYALTTASAQTAIIYDDEKDFTVEKINDSNSARITKYAGRNTELKIPPRIGDLPVTEIGERVFVKKGLVSVVIPESVIFIGNMAFADNQIVSVSIGANVYIANNAFDGSGNNFSFVSFYNSQERKAGTYGNGWRLVSAAVPTSASASITGAATPASTASSDSSLNSVEVISPTSGWYVIYDDKSSANISFDKEQIDGREWDVLSINANNMLNGWAGAQLNKWGVSGNIIQSLKNANGIRFKVLGDGKKWRVYLGTSDVKDGCYHGLTKSTQKGKVTSIDIPFNRLKQSDWGRRTAFIKDNINFICFQRDNDTGQGASVIKVFDFEIY